MRFIGIIIALVLALVAGIAVLSFTGKEDKQEVLVNPQAPNINIERVNVLTAAQDIPVGTKIESTMVDRQGWPKHLVLEQFITENDAASVIDTVSRGAFLKGEPLIRSKLANKDDPSFLAAMLPEGMRVVTIQTDAVSGLAGFVFPGDRVDVLFTHEIEAPAAQPIPGTSETMGGDEPPTRLTEVLVSDIKVLAVDQKSTAAGDKELKAPTTVSVEVTAQDAQRIRLASIRGTLALALRSLKDKDIKTDVPPTREADISSAAANQPGQLENPIIVVRGVNVEVIRNTMTPSAPAPMAMEPAQSPTLPAIEGNR